MKKPFGAALANVELDLPSFDVMQDQINGTSVESLQSPGRNSCSLPGFFTACFSLKKKTRFITSPLT